MRPLAAVAAFLATIVAANWLTGAYGLIPVGFGLMATAGTFAAGAAFVARDLTQEAGGRRWVVLAILAGGALSWAVSPAVIAAASTVTFLVSETIDFAVYTPLRERRWFTAVIASGIVGATVDTFLFLYLAGFPITPASVTGQLVVKFGMVAVTGGAWALIRYRRAVPA